VQSEMYQTALEISIAEAEWGESPYDWNNCPFSDIRYTLSDRDISEASGMFGELEDDEDIEQFEEWIDSLQSTRYFQVRSAIETIRSALADYQQDLNMERLLRAIQPA
jgi:hypothetical protein